MVLEGIDLCGLWVRVSPELYGCFGCIILRHHVRQFMFLIEGAFNIVGQIKRAFGDVETIGHAESSPEKQNATIQG